MPTMTLSTYLRITRASALFDIFIVAPFATPWTFQLLYPQLGRLNLWMGGAALLEPSLALGRYDGAGRFLFATWMLWALAAGGLPLVWLFLVPELLWGVAQCWPVAPARTERRSKRPGLKLVHASWPHSLYSCLPLLLP